MKKGWQLITKPGLLEIIPMYVAACMLVGTGSGIGKTYAECNSEVPHFRTWKKSWEERGRGQGWADVGVCADPAKALTNATPADPDPVYVHLGHFGT